MPAKPAKPAWNRRASQILAVSLPLGFLYAATALYLTDARNPDWSAYQDLFLSGGAWLFDQNRDILFLTVIELSATILGADGYIWFRVLIGIYFLWFLTFSQRKLHAYSHYSAADSAVVCSILLTLAATKFTVQIREGLAVTLVILSLFMLSAHIRAPSSSALRLASIHVLMISGGLIHSGVTIFYALLLASLALRRFIDPAALAHRRTAAALLAALLGLALALNPYMSAILFDYEPLLQPLGLTLESSEVPSNAKLAYWGFYGLVILLLLLRSAELAAATAYDETYRFFVGLLNTLLIPSLYIFALSLVLTSGPPFAISLLSRLLITAITVSMILLVSAGLYYRSLVLICVVLIVDQYRVIAVASGSL